MRHVFILNPVAGKNQSALALRDEIETYFSQHPDLEYSVKLTDGVGAATRIAREECEKGDVRLYACGGDGTLQETAFGIPAGRKDVELTVIPCGSGNDFVRTFGGAEAFCDLADLIEGVALPVDAIDCDSCVSLNIAAIGLDAAVALKMQKYKKWRGVSGSMAYNIAVVDVICHPIGVDMDLEIDTPNGTVHRSGKYLMTLAANGRFYGGGYQGAPSAVTDDGLLEFVLVKKVSRFKVPFIIGKYKTGDHDKVKCIETIRGTAMRVNAVKPMVCTVDGECFETDSIRFAVLPHAYRLVLPASVVSQRNTSAEVTAKL